MMGWMSRGYLVTRCVTSRMHSGMPRRLHSAFLLHFYIQSQTKTNNLSSMIITRVRRFAKITDHIQPSHTAAAWPHCQSPCVRAWASDLVERRSLPVTHSHVKAAGVCLEALYTC